MIKRETFEYGSFRKGLKSGYRMCCIMFFENERKEIRDKIEEYEELIHVLSGNDGAIYCPDCIVRKVKEIRK